MAETATTSLADGSTLLDLSDDGRFVSDNVPASGTDSLYVLDLANGATTFVASAPNSGNSGNPNGIDGGALSAYGRYIFYSTGSIGGNYKPGGGDTTLFVKDLPSGNPARDVTPPYQSEPFPGTARGLLAEDISSDGRYVLCGVNYSVLRSLPAPALSAPHRNREGQILAQEDHGKDISLPKGAGTREADRRPGVLALTQASFRAIRWPSAGGSACPSSPSPSPRRSSPTFSPTAGRTISTRWASSCSTSAARSRRRRWKTAAV